MKNSKPNLTLRYAYIQGFFWMSFAADLICHSFSAVSAFHASDRIAFRSLYYCTSASYSFYERAWHGKYQSG